MQVQTILNRIQGHRSFVYGPARLVGCRGLAIEVEVRPRANTRWARRLSWKEVAEVFHTSWEKVFRSVEMAVDWGRAHQELTAVSAIGIDEIAGQRGHRYLTLVCQIDEGCRRLLWIGQERRVKRLLRFCRWFGKERCAGLRFICSDMWGPYQKVISKKAGGATHILDRFHIMGYERVLKRTRWLLLKRPENLSEKQEPRLAELLQYNLRSVRAYLLKEDFQFFWSHVSPYWAGQFLDRWCTRTMRSRLEPIKEVARTLRNHRPLLLNWFRAKGVFSSGAVEGFNNKAKLTLRKSYGFRTYRAMEVSLYHALGALPKPPATHGFC